MEICRVGLDDDKMLGRVLEIWNEIWPEGITPEIFRTFLTEHPQSWVLALMSDILFPEEESVLGFAFMQRMLNTNEVVLVKFAINFRYQREGHGKTLLHACKNMCCEMGIDMMKLSVRDDNPPAKALYKKLGFIPIFVEAGAYGEGVDKVVMVTRLRGV